MRTRLTEAFKISVEIDPEDIKGMQGAAEQPSGMMSPKEKVDHNKTESSGKFGQYVAELAHGSRVKLELSEMACKLNETVQDILEDVALREDKRAYNTAESHAMGRVLREWRVFLRELGAFERRFK